MRSALALRPFRRLALAYGVNAFGNWLAEIALVILVYRTTGSPLAVAALMIAGQLLPGLVSPALVAWTARFPGRSVLPALHLIEAALLATLGVLGAKAPLAAIIVVVFADGVLGVTARGLVKAAVVSVTKPHGLLREGNAVLGLAFTVCAAAGPAAAGWLSGTWGVQAAVLLDAASFVVAAAALRLAAPVRPEASSDEPFLTRFRAGVAHVRDRFALRRLILADAACCVLLAMILPIEIVFVSTTLHCGPAALGAVLTAWGVGSIAGGLLLARLRRVPVHLLLLAGILAMSAAYLGMGAAGSVLVVVAFSALGGIGNGLEAFGSLTVIQQATADRFQTRVNGLVESIHAGGPGIGFLLGGLVAAAVSPRAAYLVAGAGTLVVVACAVVALWRVDWANPGAEPVLSAAPRPVAVEAA